MRKWAMVAAVGERQQLLIAVWQLRVLGVSDAELAERVNHHGWRRATAGVIALPGVDTDERKLAALVLAYSRPTGAATRVEERGKPVTRAGDGGDPVTSGNGAPALIEALVEVALSGGQVVTGHSALWLHGIAAKPSTHTIRLTKNGGHAERRGVRLRRGPSTGPTIRISGLPVVDVAQAFMDAAAGDPATSAAALHHQLTKLIATADAKRKITPQALEERLASAPRFVGAPALRRALADVNGELSHSATERKARRIVAKVLAKYGLTLHRRPYAVTLGSRTVGEADLAVVSLRLDLEIDGPHHLLPTQSRKDRLRDRWMRRAGWEVERFSTELVDLWPVTFAAQVEECVRARLGVRPSRSDSPG